MLALAPACSQKEDWELLEDGEGLVLRFYSDESSLVTKATTERAGEDPYNENTLASVEYFLYSDANKDGDAVIHGYIENVRQNAPISVPMTSDVVNYTLCPGNAPRFWVYAIANHPRIVAAGDPEVLTGTDVATLAALNRDIEMTDGSVNTPQSKFLMSTDGPFEVTPVRRRNTIVATANIGLKRVAAKITVSVRVVPEVSIKNTITISGVTDTRTEIWRPRLEEMQVYLVNGAKTGQVSGEPVVSILDRQTPEQYTYQAFNFDTNAGESYSYDTYIKRVDGEGNEILDAQGLVQYDKVTETGIFYPAEHPFYTYPEDWMYGTEEEPYIKISIPWDREAGVSDQGTPFGRTSKIYYYRVYCPASPMEQPYAQFLRNHWYKVILNVGILGSETDGGEMIINGNYYVVDWQERSNGGGEGGTAINDSDKEAEIKGARYLFLNEQNFIMYNLEDLMIPYVTSDPCEIVAFQAKKYVFSGSNKQELTITNMADWNMDLSLVTTSTGAHISFNHPLNNDLTTNDYDVSKYLITFKIRHKDDPSYVKEVSIEQRPAILIDMDNNGSTGDATHHGYTYVNGGTGTTYGTNGTSTGTNTNFNMFIIETTVLPADSDYMLGDPRLTTVDNLNNWPTRNAAVSNWSVSAASVQGGNRVLSYYYPVNDNAAADNIIAPKYRVASSHGATTTLNYQYAFRRCASYQEKGYPAGRWRLPTVAEVSYITKLNADGKIARLFGSTGNGTMDYWCNSGYITVYNGDSTNAPVPHTGTGGTNKYVRCVYDEWYWDGMKITVGGTETDVTTVNNTTFTWGDVER